MRRPPFIPLSRLVCLMLTGFALITAAPAAAAPAVRPLPPSFAWGVSSSAFQSEGGKLDDNWQRYIAAHKDFQPYGRSVDFLHRYPQDIALAARLGVNTYRISINWARVEPKRGTFDQHALRYYDKVIATMRAHGIAPLITLDHWDYPGWVFDQGSWATEQTATDFVAYARLIARRYHTQAHRWLTFNEASFYRIAEGAYRGLDAGGQEAMTANLVTAHRGAYDAIHAADPTAQVSSNVVWQRNAAMTVAQDPFLQGVKDKLDYFGVDYYYPGYKDSDLTNAILGTGWKAQLDPFGIYTALRELHRAFPALPIMVTENGMATDDGKRRADGYRRGQNLQDTVYWVQRARAAGVPVIGYLYWSLTDNYEFGSYRSRFGLYTVDVRTDPKLRRTATDAVAAYRSVIRKRGVPAAYRLVRRPARADCARVPVAERSTCAAAAR
jgi:beta-glucosidase